MRPFLLPVAETQVKLIDALLFNFGFTKQREKESDPTAGH